MSKRPLNNGNGAKRQPSKVDVGYLIKTAACIVVFLGAVALFSYVCRQLAANYLLLMSPSIADTIPWLSNLGISILFLTIMAGVVAILVRPYWLVLAIFVVSAVLYPLIVGSSLASWIVAGVYALLMCVFLGFVANQLKNQINFSAHPLSDMKLLLLSLAAVQVCVAFGLGYVQDASRRGYILPPEVKTPIASGLLGQAKANIESQKATPAQKKIAIDDATKKAQATVDDFEKQFIPIKQYIPFSLGFLLFILLQAILLVFGFVPIVLARLLFIILKVTRFAEVKVETREIKHLTLSHLPLATDKSSK